MRAAGFSCKVVRQASAVMPTVSKIRVPPASNAWLNRQGVAIDGI